MTALSPAASLASAPALHAFLADLPFERGSAIATGRALRALVEAGLDLGSVGRRAADGTLAIDGGNGAFCAAPRRGARARHR